MSLNRSPDWILDEVLETDRIYSSNIWSRSNSANIVDHDQGHPQTTCIFKTYYSNLANGFQRLFSLGCHGNHSSSRNMESYRNFNQVNISIILVKYYSNMGSGFTETDF